MANTQPPIDLSALGRLLESIAGQNTMMFPQLSALPAGLTGTNIRGAFDPETMLLSGAFSPTQFESAIDSTYQKMLNDYNQQVARLTQVPYEATFGSLSFNNDPSYAQGTEIGELMRDAVDAIASGAITAPEAIANINNAIASGAVPADVASSIGKISSDLTNFADKELPRYQQALAKYEYDSAQALANAGLAEPTRQDARVEFYSSIGLPQLALLPDPSAQYEIDPYFFSDPTKVAELQKNVTRAEQVIPGEEARFAKELQAEQGWLGRTKRKMEISSSAAKAAERAKAQYLKKNMPKDTRDTLGKVADWVGSAPIVGGLFGGDQRAQDIKRVQDEAQAVYDRVYQQKVQKRMATPYVAQGGRNVYDLSPAAKKARDEKLISEAALRVMAAGNKPKIAQAQAQLAAAGLTPWQQAMNQLLAGAVGMQTKNK